MRFQFSILLSCILLYSASAQSGHEIKVKIDGFEEDVLYLAYHLGGKQYIEDTVYRSTDDTFSFTHESEALQSGYYMVVIPPDNKFLEILINRTEQHFTVSASLTDLIGTASFEGNASDNILFYEYLNFISTQRTLLDNSKAALGTASDQTEIKKQADLESAVNKQVKAYQDRLIKDYPNSMSALVVKANLPLDYSALQDNSEIATWEFTKAHFFDNINLNDDRLLRTPFLEQRIEYFFDKLQVQRPEDIIPAVDKILSSLDVQGENFKFLAIHFLNKYAKSKTVGLDAVYVHIAQNYYVKGLATWTETVQLEKILKNAARLEPLLIGKTTPDLSLRTKDGFKVNLHDLESEFTVLYFWRPDCDNCEKTAPILQEFFEAYKDKGVKIAAICTKRQSEIDGCWAYVDENNYTEWIHLADPDQNSNMTDIYNIKSTPLIYVLDKDKKIISKLIGANQLKQVIDFELKK